MTGYIVCKKALRMLGVHREKGGFLSILFSYYLFL